VSDLPDLLRSPGAYHRAVLAQDQPLRIKRGSTDLPTLAPFIDDDQPADAPHLDEQRRPDGERYQHRRVDRP
jgi:hypothetical protein